MKFVRLVAGIATLVSLLMFGSCREDLRRADENNSSDVVFKNNRSENVRDLGGSDRNQTNNDAFGEDAQMTLIREARTASSDWKYALESAQIKYSGKDLDEFLYRYANARASERDFDRVGFIEGLKEIRGPGSVFSSILTSIYSGRIDISPSVLVGEIERIELSPLEEELLAASLSTSPVLARASIQEISDLIGGIDKNCAMYNSMVSLGLDKVYGALDDKTPEGVAALLGQYPNLMELDFGAVVDRSAQSNPGPWWDSFVHYCEGEGGDHDDMVERYAASMIDGFFKHRDASRIIDEIDKIMDTELKVKLAEDVASRWATYDSGDVAKWANTARPGRVRDIVVCQLSLRLNAVGLKSEAREWAKTVQDKRVSEALERRGLISND